MKNLAQNTAYPLTSTNILAHSTNPGFSHTAEQFSASIAASSAGAAASRPQFAVFNRPNSVHRDVVQKITDIPASAVKQAGKSMIFDLSGVGYNAYHGRTSEKVVAPIMTAKVARGDTLMIQYGLEREGRQGDILFIDGSESSHNPDSPAYANVGGLLREIAIQKGFVGFVSNGFIRDSKEYWLKETDRFFATYAKGITPNGPTKMEAGALNIPLQIEGNTINSGDLFIAEGKDIFVIAAQNAEKLLQLLKESPTSYQDTSSMPQRQSSSYSTATKEQSGTTPSSHIQKIAHALEKTRHVFNLSPVLRTTPVTRELLSLMKHVPTAEYADSYSTLEPAQTTGISLKMYSKSEPKPSAGLALVSDGTEASIKQTIAKAKDKHTLVIKAEHPDDIVLNDTLVKSASQKGISAIVTNGTAALRSASTMPVYAAHFTQTFHPVKSGDRKPVSGQALEIAGVAVRQGNVIVGDEDGVVSIPQGLEEFGMRGGHAIAAKEMQTLESIRAGTAEKRKLPHNLLPVSGQGDIAFFRQHIQERSAPVQTARGSSGLSIPKPDSIYVSPLNDSSELTTAVFESVKKLDGEQTITGVPTDIIFDKEHPVIIGLKNKNNQTGKENVRYVKGIQGDDFLRTMKAKETKTPIQIEANGRVTIKQNAVEKSMARLKS